MIDAMPDTGVNLRGLRQHNRALLPRGFTPEQAVTAIADAARILAADSAGVLGLGVGSVGPLDHHSGLVRDATNMPGWHDVPLRELLADRTGLPVTLDKNTNAA